MTEEFRRGDRVRLNERHDYHRLYQDVVGTVRGKWKTPGTILVKWDGKDFKRGYPESHLDRVLTPCGC